MDKEKNSVSKLDINLKLINIDSLPVVEYSLEDQTIIDKIKEKRKINPTQTRGIVEIFYEGKNRNRNYISDEVKQMLIEDLPNTPVVGKFSDEDADFSDHGELIHKVDKNGNYSIARTTCIYGVVPADTEVWEKEEIDELSGQTRKYICAEIVLWSSRCPELEILLQDKNRPQSMELDPFSVKGEYKVNENGEKIFYFTEAHLSGLCILGKMVEPCFEESKISVLDSEKSWQYELKNMMKDISESLYSINEEMIEKKLEYLISNNINGKSQIVNKDKMGGKNIMLVNLTFFNTGDIRETIFKSVNSYNEESQTYDFKWAVCTVDDYGREVILFNYENNTFYKGYYMLEDGNLTVDNLEKIYGDFKTKSEVDEMKKIVGDYGLQKSEITRLKEELKEEKEAKKDYQLTKEEYDELKEAATNYEKSKEEFEELKKYKTKTERKAKEEVIAQFSKLGKETLKPFEENMDEYTLEQLDEKLCALSFKKGIQINAEENLGEEDRNFTINDSALKGSSKQKNVPDWMNEVLDYEKKIFEN